jgi:hypothetical protein
VDDDLLVAERADVMITRAELKRNLGIDDCPRENDLNTAWSVTHYVHVGSTKYPVRTAGDLYCVTLLGWAICSRTLEKVRDEVIEALEGVGA